MILQPASRKELKRIAVGSAVCAVLEIALFWLLGILGIGRFSYRIVTGTLGGTLMGILNFALMCLMIQNATGITDEKLMKAKVRGSYNLRKIIQILWVVAAFLIPGIIQGHTEQTRRDARLEVAALQVAGASASHPQD